MTVRSADGYRVGIIIALSDGKLAVEKGLFLSRDIRVDVAEVADLREGEVVLAVDRDTLERRYWGLEDGEEFEEAASP